ncbi:alginate export family protein [Roseivirga sp.]|uniref:alginate export family protein n=1 Tax=Roseivirga sp. TaxID=1964215 RepID=UPI002B26CBF6|nr:alginate export family protein [Roseivirga sp.]
MRILKGISVVFFLLYFSNLHAQISVDAQLRSRFEYRHGYKTLFPNNTDPAAFIGQRTRLNVDYKTEKLDVLLSFQNISVWGDVPQLNTSDRNGLMIYQAWAKIHLTETFAIKAGRQEIIYDDSRIFGNVDWATQGRSHDALQLKWQNEGFKLDVGLAYNQVNEQLTGNDYNILGSYKTFQYLWLHKDWSNFSTSFLMLNNGLQYIDNANSQNNEVRYSQTIGLHSNYKKDKLGLSSNLFYQGGKDAADLSLSAYLMALSANYKLSDTWSTVLGGELISGNDNGVPNNQKNKAFNPLYGTNHKFNGFMDYFYVGNHYPNAGLTDIYLTNTTKLNTKSSLSITLHNFSAASDIAGSSKKQLGNEVDLVFSHAVQKSISLKLGYSQLFASDGMEILKGNSDSNANNWAWVMLDITPTLFKNTEIGQ